MAGVLVWHRSGEVAVVAGVTKTVLGLKAANNHRIKVLQIKIFGKGTSATDTPMKVEGQVMTADGTGTATNPTKNNPADDETIQSSSKLNYTVEPTYTANAIPWTDEVHPQTGLLEFLPYGQELIIPGGGLFGIQVTAVQNQTVSIAVLVDE